MHHVIDSSGSSIIVRIFQMKKLRPREIKSASWPESECKARGKPSHNAVLSPLYKAQVTCISITFADLYLDSMVTSSCPVSWIQIYTLGGFLAMVGSSATWITHGLEIAMEPWSLTLFCLLVTQGPGNLTPYFSKEKEWAHVMKVRGAPWNVAR